MRRLLWLIPVGWLIFCLVLSVEVMVEALDHGAPGEFRDLATGEIQWINWLGLGLGWFLMIGVPPAVLSSMIARAVNRRPRTS
ncbi:MAG: hypothetical protein HKN04_06375 [Rhodothermaceae bacterium]|nr:hypothetical protein [Rhodothermaceae bacterium]